MSHVAVQRSDDDNEIQFNSRDGSYHLRRDGNSWVVDEVDDRGMHYVATASFSDFELAEKYLIWRWASIARSALGLKQLGVVFHRQGLKAGTMTAPSSRDHFVELRVNGGIAVLPESNVTIFSHVLPMTINDLERTLREGLE